MKQFKYYQITSKLTLLNTLILYLDENDVGDKVKKYVKVELIKGDVYIYFN